MKQSANQKLRFIYREATARLERSVLIAAFVVFVAVMLYAAGGKEHGPGRFDRTKAELATLRGLLETFKVDTGRYPTTAEGLDALRFPPPDVNHWRGPYTDKEIPKDLWGNDYIYARNPNGDLHLWSYGADGQPGGSGKAADVYSE